MDINQKILVTFNKYFYDLMEDLQAINSWLKGVIVNQFQVRQMKTDKNINFLLKSLDESIYGKLTSTTDTHELFGTDPVAGMRIFSGMTLKDLSEGTESAHHPTILSYLYVLVLLATIYDFKKTSDMDEKERLEVIEELFNNAMAIVCGIEKNEDYSKSLNNVYDTNILGLLIAMGSLQKTRMKMNDSTGTEEETNQKEENANSSSSPPLDSDPFMEKMKNALHGSKIGQFTNEIMSELTSEMKDDMNDVSNIDDFMKSGKVGNVINKTVQYFEKKNKSGEFTQEDIMKECANLMGIFGNTMPGTPTTPSGGGSGSSTSPSSPSFDMGDIQNIMKLFSSDDKFKLDSSKVQKEDTKNRLRKKLESKQKQKDK